jgi:hypothetical protein
LGDSARNVRRIVKREPAADKSTVRVSPLENCLFACYARQACRLIRFDNLMRILGTQHGLAIAMFNAFPRNRSAESVDRLLERLARLRENSVEHSVHIVEE